MSEESPVVTETPAAADAPASSTPDVTSETPTDATSETQDSSLVDDVKVAREAEESKGKKPPVDPPKPVAKATEGGDDEGKKGDEPEPENLTDADKNRLAWIKRQRDAQLQEASKLAEDKKALEAEKAELEKQKSEISAKPKTDESKPAETKVDQPAAVLENYKPITLLPYEENGVASENENEQALKIGIEALAKDVQAFQTAKQAEIDALRAELKVLRDLADPFIPDEHGVTKASIQAATEYSVEQAIQASEMLMGEFGPDTELKLDPVNLMAALNEFGPGFVTIGEIKPENLLSKESILHCWRHANKAELDKLKEAPAAKTEKEKRVAPPIRKSDGKPAAAVSYEDMTEREKMVHDLKQEEAILNGRR